MKNSRNGSKTNRKTEHRFRIGPKTPPAATDFGSGRGRCTRSGNSDLSAVRTTGEEAEDQSQDAGVELAGREHVEKLLLVNGRIRQRITK